MKDDPFHLLLCDFDRRLAYLTDEVYDATPWIARVDDLREEGKNVTCQALPPMGTVSSRAVVEKFCSHHGLTLTREPFVKVE